MARRQLTPEDLVTPRAVTTEIRSLELIKQLVAVNTVSCNSNLPLVQLVSGYLEEAGVASVIRMNPDGDKANLIATVPAANGSSAGGLVLSGHTDVVPVDGQRWTTDPFVATVRDGRIYGRGVTDMKGFIGVALAMVPRMVRAKLSEPIHFALSYDEEIGLFGGAQMIDDFQELGLTPSRCIVGEPTGMRVISAHKSIAMLKIKVRGRAAHSSLAPHHVSAVFHGARLVSFIQDLAEEFQVKGPFDEGYDVPFSTISVNQLWGGSHSTTVPAECHVRLDFRTIAEVDPSEVLDRIRERVRQIETSMQALDPTTGIDLTVLAMAPGLESTPGSTFADMLVTVGARDLRDKVAFGTEAGFFYSSGIDTVVCGPGRIEQAHIADEYVSLEQIHSCERILSGVIEKCSAK